jgi:hypothetical protein
MSDTYKRVAATCKCCGKKYYEVPEGARSVQNGELVTHDFDCDCRPGMANGVEIVTKNGLPLTAEDLAFELAKAGVTP